MLPRADYTVGGIPTAMSNAGEPSAVAVPRPRPRKRAQHDAEEPAFVPFRKARPALLGHPVREHVWSLTGNEAINPSPPKGCHDDRRDRRENQDRAEGAHLLPFQAGSP